MRIPACEVIVNKHLIKIKDVTGNMARDLLKRFMAKLKGPRI